MKEFKTTLTIAGKVDKSLDSALKAAEKASKSSAARIADEANRAAEKTERASRSAKTKITDHIKKTADKTERESKSATSKMVDHAKKAANKIGSIAQSAGSKIINGFKTVVKTAGTVMAVGLTSATLAVGALGSQAVKNAAELQTQMQNVATLLDGPTDRVKARTRELSDDILKVSNTTGIATSDLTSGLYDVISAVGDTDDSIRILEISAKSAAAGNAETSQAVALLTAVTKGYGDTSGEAFEKVSDLAFQTVKLGQTTFPELAASIGKVTPLASALGVKQEELFGVFATLTGVTGTAAEVSTQYKAVLSGLMSPTKGMTEALKQMGYESGAAAIQTLGFQGTLKQLMETQNNDTMATSKLFSSVEAQTSILALCGEQADNLAKKTDAMFNSAGAADTAFATQTDNLEYNLQRIKNLWQNFLTSTGNKIMPHIADIASKALPMLESALDAVIPQIDEILEKAGPKISAVLEKIAPFVTKIISKIPTLISGLGKVGSYIGSKLTPIIQTFMDVATKVGSKLGPIIQNIVSRFSGGGLFEQIKQLAGIGDSIGQGIGSALSKPTDNGALNAIANIGQTFGKGMEAVSVSLSKQNPVGSMIDSMSQMLPKMIEIALKAGEIFNSIRSTAVEVFSEMAPIITEAVGAILNSLSGAGQKIKEIIDGCVKIAMNLVDIIKQIIPVAANIIATLIPIVMEIASAISNLAPTILSVVSAVIPLISTIVDSISNMAPIISEIINLAIQCAGQVMEVVAPIISQIVESLTPAIGNIMGIVQSLMPVIKTVLQAVKEIVSHLSVLTPVINLLIEGIGMIANVLTATLKAAIDVIMPIIQSIINLAKNIIFVFEDMIAFFTNVFVGNWQGVWDSMVSIVEDIWEAIKNVIITAIRVIVAPINLLIKGANKALKIFNKPEIPEISISGFANGGTVTAPTLAVIGEGGADETIIPHKNTPRSRELLATATKGVYGTDAPVNNNKSVQYTYSPVINVSDARDTKEVLREDFERFKSWIEQRESEDDREVFV